MGESLERARIRIERDSEGAWHWEVILPDGTLYAQGGGDLIGSPMGSTLPTDAMRAAMDAEARAVEEGLSE